MQGESTRWGGGHAERVAVCLALWLPPGAICCRCVRDHWEDGCPKQRLFMWSSCKDTMILTAHLITFKQAQLWRVCCSGGDGEKGSYCEWSLFTSVGIESSTMSCSNKSHNAAACSYCSTEWFSLFVFLEMRHRQKPCNSAWKRLRCVHK